MPLDNLTGDTRLEHIIENFGPGKRPYHEMYQYIFEQFGSEMPVEQRYWFEQAAEINEYLNEVATADIEHRAARVGRTRLQSAA